MRYVTEISIKLRKIQDELNKAKFNEIKIICRKIAKAEMELQACRSLLEARLFQAEIDNEEAPKDGEG